MNRRALLRAVGGIGAVGLAGCSVLGTGGGSAVSATFEGDSVPSSLRATGQAEALGPRITSDYATQGSQSLLLPSEPGTASKTEVTTEGAVTPPATMNASATLVTDGGTEHAAAIGFKDAQSPAEVKLLLSDYYDVSQLHVITQSSGEKFETARLPTRLSESGWTELSLTLGEGRARASIGETDAEATVPTDLFGSEVYAYLSANAWGSGHDISMAVDSLTVSGQ